MGIPRKRSKAIEVNGKAYRYLIRQDGPLIDRDEEDPSLSYMKPQQKFLLVTIQEDSDRPGNVLQWKRQNTGDAVHPSEVGAYIQKALASGWDPSLRGKAFVLA